MPGRISRRSRRFGRIKDVRFMEVEFVRPIEPRMVIEVEGGLRLVVADDESVELAAQLLNALSRGGGRKGGRK